MPGYTHLQRAIPVTLGHHLLAWVEMLERDRARFRFAAGQARPSPLGAGALAGSTLPLPPPPEPMRNSIDAVADRDFALDYLYAAAVLFTHLSRIGEELVLWTTSEFGFARLPEDAATGSSMMPQKLNPDVAELARGKAGTAIGRLTGLLADGEGPPARLRPRPPGGQAAGVRGARATSRARSTRWRCSCAASRSTASAWPPRAPTRSCARPTRPRRSSAKASRSATRTSRSPPGPRRHVRAPAVTSRHLQARGIDVGRCGRGGEGALVVKTSPLPVSLSGRDFLRDRRPASAAEIEAILDLAADAEGRPRSRSCRARRSASSSRQPSTRTRISFSVAIAQLGGTPSRSCRARCSSRAASRSRTPAQVLSRYLDALAIRTLSHDELEAWAEAATIPVINALTDDEHPCQALADALTIRERLGTLDGVRIAWVGDGTNVLVSLAVARERSSACTSSPPAPRATSRRPERRRARPRPARSGARRRRARHRHLGLARPGGDARAAAARPRAVPPRRVAARARVAGGDRPPLPAGAPGRGDHAGGALRRALGGVGRGREPAARRRRRCSRCCSPERQPSRRAAGPRVPHPRGLGEVARSALAATRPASG